MRFYSLRFFFLKEVTVTGLDITFTFCAACHFTEKNGCVCMREREGGKRGKHFIKVYCSYNVGGNRN